jgi:CcmD family protein
MNKLKTIALTITLGFQTLLIAGSSVSQNNENGVSESAKEMLRGNAKFNVVATVLVLIFIGIVVYLLRLDRKMSKLEKQFKNK